MASFREKTLFAKKVLPSLPSRITRGKTEFYLKIYYDRDKDESVAEYAVKDQPTLISASIHGRNIPRVAMILLRRLVDTRLLPAIQSSRLEWMNECGI